VNVKRGVPGVFLSFVHVISQMPEAHAVALPYCLATGASVFEAEGVRASAVVVGALLTCAVIVVMAHVCIGCANDLHA
jgi:hypothetical protein